MQHAETVALPNIEKSVEGDYAFGDTINVVDQSIHRGFKNFKISNGTTPLRKSNNFSSSPAGPEAGKATTSRKLQPKISMKEEYYSQTQRKMRAMGSSISRHSPKGS